MQILLAFLRVRFAHMFPDSNVTFFIWRMLVSRFLVMLVVDEMSHNSTGHHDLEYRANIGTFLKWEFQCVFFLLRFFLTPAFSTVHWPKLEAESDMSCERKTSAKLSAQRCALLAPVVNCSSGGLFFRPSDQILDA